MIVSTASARQPQRHLCAGRAVEGKTAAWGIESAEVSGRMRGSGGGVGFGVENGVGDGGSYGRRTGGLNLGGQHFNNRWMAGISEATKSRTGTRRIIARSDHHKMITSDPGPSRLPLAFPYHPLGEPDSNRQDSMFGTRDSVCPVVRALGKTRTHSRFQITSPGSKHKVRT